MKPGNALDLSVTRERIQKIETSNEQFGKLENIEQFGIEKIHS